MAASSSPSITPPASAAVALSPSPRGRSAVAGALAAAVLLTVVFWHGLWAGRGLVGSDVYAYFLPQKAYYAECLRAGALPLWNNRIGQGYPQVAESQTGVFYPLHLPLYLVFDLNTAFNASLLLHYGLAFWFTWLYARRLGLAPIAAGLAALIYTYGWFPPRVFLEWAILGGAWLPAALWCAETYLQTRRWRYCFWLTVVLALQMLAGHFLLAFITQLTLVGYVPLRLWFAGGDLPEATRAARPRAAIRLGLAVAAAFGLAAVQLFPTWELKQQSQRLEVSQEHDPAYGYIPAPYLSQIVAPWIWYPDEGRFNALAAKGSSRTNRVEAHLYFGLVPLMLVIVACSSWRRGIDRQGLVWCLLGLAALVYTTGALVPIARHLPGFSFFEGPGRFGVVTTLAAGILAALGYAQLERVARRGVRALLTVSVFALTTVDLWIVGHTVTHAEIVRDPPIERLADSPLKHVLSDNSQPVRLLGPGANLLSLLEVSTATTYLGLGPAAYFDPELKMPEPFSLEAPPRSEHLEWLARTGVTHVLSFSPLDLEVWPARLIWEGPDPFLNAAMGRVPGEPYYLYRLRSGRGRVAWEEPAAGANARVTSYGPNRVAIEAESPNGGRVILTDLAYPGWKVEVDGQQPAEPQSVERMFRALTVPAGNHSAVWTYSPASLYWGAIVSAATLVILLSVAHVLFWHPTST